MEAKLTSSPANKKISNQYSLNNKSIPSYVLEVIRKLQQYDFQAYMVGGCIRDLLLNIQPKDFDIATNAHPDQVTAIFKNSIIIGRRFKIVHVRIDRQIIEVSTFRKKPSEVNKLRNGVVQDNAFGTIEEDAQRRGPEDELLLQRGSGSEPGGKKQQRGSSSTKPVDRLPGP